MTKMHTRIKRGLGLTSSHNHKIRVRKGNGKRTFKTEEAALAYAKEHNLTGKIIPAKKGKRFQIE